MTWKICLASIAASALLACGGAKDAGSSGGGVLTITASQTQVLANGVNQVLIHVTGSQKGPVVIRTDRGGFLEASGAVSATNPTTPFDVTLVTCDSRVTPGPTCVGMAQLRASDGNLATGQLQVRFVAVEICSDARDNNADGLTDCQDTATCPAGTTCDAGGKTCGGGTCSVCTGKGGAPEVAEVSCGDGFDNDCDGLVDCADPDCAGDICNSAPSTGGGLTTGVCGATTKLCTCTATPETGAKCGDGIDDDCDGLIDCEDPDCQDKGSGGQACDGRGHTCSAAIAGASSCSVCAGNGGAAQAVETDCADGKDNDCDGLVDCADPDCATAWAVCTATGKTCNPTTASCVCQGPEAAKELSCGDGQDNDCDGKIDCADPDCASVACTAFGSVCSPTVVGVCTCNGNGGVPQQGKELGCSDGKDNDCDGAVDCADRDCGPTAPGNTYGQQCAGTLTNVLRCDGLGQCACTGNGGTPEPFEQSCGDGKDNDCDGLVDCADPDCASRACNASGKACTNLSGVTNTCSVCSPPGSPAIPGEVAESSCGDGRDTDCDGLSDCADSDCLAKTCFDAPVTSGPGTTTGKCTAAKTCVCNGGVAQATETSCGDGKDNDCDGLIDCDDPDCRPVGNALGAVCDARGNTCSPVVGGVSTCAVCSGNGGTPQAVETACSDGKDNDCDGLVDCQDPNCASAACSATGKTCNPTTLVCECTGAEVGGEVSCGDGLDNDCDGKIDCADTDCNLTPKSCGPNGQTCSPANGGTCICTGNGGVAMASEGTTGCADGKDNDCDGLIDCADPGCRPATVGAFGQACQTVVGRFGEKCDFVGQCVCPGGQVAETSCSDGIDNDCDGLIDCADPDCAGKICGANGLACSAGTPSVCTCPSGSVESGVQCRDNIDNNCDGKVDCNDPGCQGAPFGAQCGTNVLQLCALSGATWVCKDTSSSYVLTVSATATRLAANGLATTTVTATLSKDTGTITPQGGQTIDFTTSLGTVGPTATTNGAGQASVTFTSSTASGPAVVTASYFTGTTTISNTVTITLPQLAQVNLVNQQYAVMGALGSGFQESNEFTFQLVDSANQTYPAGLAVAFEHGQLGGSYIGASAAGCAANVCTASGVTDATGKVKVILHSGSIANVVSVVARAQAGGSNLLQATAGNIAIVGAKATGAEISIDCSPKNIPALTSHDCTNSTYAGADSKITCVVTLADRFKNKLGVATAGAVLHRGRHHRPPRPPTPAYNPSGVLPTQQGNLRRTSSVIDTNGAKLPTDVLPQVAGEFDLAHDWALDGCASQSARPAATTRATAWSPSSPRSAARRASSTAPTAARPTASTTRPAPPAACSESASSTSASRSWTSTTTGSATASSPAASSTSPTSTPTTTAPGTGQTVCVTPAPPSGPRPASSTPVTWRCRTTASASWPRGSTTASPARSRRWARPRRGSRSRTRPPPRHPGRRPGAPPAPST